MEALRPERKSIERQNGDRCSRVGICHCEFMIMVPIICRTLTDVVDAGRLGMGFAVLATGSVTLWSRRNEDDLDLEDEEKNEGELAKTRGAAQGHCSNLNLTFLFLIYLYSEGKLMIRV